MSWKLLGVGFFTLGAAANMILCAHYAETHATAKCLWHLAWFAVDVTVVVGFTRAYFREKP